MKGFAGRAGRGVEAVLVTGMRAVAQQIEHIDPLAGWNRALGGVEGLQGDFDGVHGSLLRLPAAQSALTPPIWRIANGSCSDLAGMIMWTGCPQRRCLPTSRVSSPSSAWSTRA